MNSMSEQFKAHQPALESELNEAVTISGVAGPYRIFQRVKGHRHSLDDAITGWYALQKAPTAKRFLDLGTGVGTVGLTVLWGLGSDATMVGIEAQAISFALLKANIGCNGLHPRVEIIHGDIREVQLNDRFELITGSPPYFPINTGVLPPDSQKAHARFELRGHVGDYAAAAKRHLAPGGLFVFCFPYQQKTRGIGLVEAQGFRLRSARDVIPRAGKPALFSLFSAQLEAPEQELHTPCIEEPPFTVADSNGIYTAEMRAMQASRGFGPDGTNPPSE